MSIHIYSNMKDTNRLVKNTILFEKDSNSEKRILILGDSLAYGVGTSSPSKSFAGRISSKYPQYDIINRATIGATTHELASSLETIEGEQYDQAYILVGGNDIARYGIDMEESIKNMRTIVESVSKRSNHVFVYTIVNFRHVTVLPSYFRGFYSNRSSYFRDGVKNISRDFANVSVVDTFGTDGEMFRSYLADDEFHLNDNGIDALVNALPEERY